LIRYAAARSAIADALENFERRTSAAMELCVEASVNLDEKLGGFDEIYQPRMISEFNGHAVMVVKAKGSFVWHSHPETDDFFLVLKGRMTIHLRDRDIVLGPGDLFVVPRGVEHWCRRITSGCRRTSLGRARSGLRRPLGLRPLGLRKRAARAASQRTVYPRRNSLATARR
jgi:mannose-6-phosphate isomerase-like protein (cupin superfamily)